MKMSVDEWTKIVVVPIILLIIIIMGALYRHATKIPTPSVMPVDEGKVILKTFDGDYVDLASDTSDKGEEILGSEDDISNLVIKKLEDRIVKYENMIKNKSMYIDLVDESYDILIVGMGMCELLSPTRNVNESLVTPCTEDVHGMYKELISKI